MAIAQKLASEGRTVEVLAESTVKKVKSADFLVDGVKTELKTVSRLTGKDMSKGLRDRILHGAGQAPHIIADVRGQAGMTVEIATEAVERAFGVKQALRQVRVIGNGFDITLVPKPR